MTGLAALAAVLGLLALAPGARAEDACAPEGRMGYVCGPMNAEDLVLTPGTRWIIASGMTGPGRATGGLYLIDSDRKTSKVLTPEVARAAGPPFADCPSPLDLSRFAPHGLAIRPGARRRDTLYVVNHGGRESIEVFDVDASGAEPRLTWIGCVVLPNGASGNAVAPLPGGGFVATKFQTAGDPQAFQKMADGIKDGLLYEWTPKGGFKTVPGSAMSGANGVEVSADGKWIFANAWPEQRVIRFRRGGAGKPVAVKLDFLPDNIRRSPDGKLLVGGQVGPIKTLLSCSGHCPHEWKVVKLDPVTMKVTPVLDVPGTDAFSDATVGIEVGRTIWVGTYRGDRVAYAGGR